MRQPRAILYGTIMFAIALCIFLIAVEQCVPYESVSVPFRDEKYFHEPASLKNSAVTKLSDLSNVTHMEHALNNICVVRIVGSTQHKRVKNFIKNSMKNLGWTVESDVFEDNTPVFGKLQFENIIAKLNPNAKRYLTMACHFDSKYTRERNFVGATDSAVPCAQLLNLATVMNEHLRSIKNQDVSLMFIFFDGEEAFHNWGPQDSIYGARHLAKAWTDKRFDYLNETNIPELHRMDMLILLDLIGASDPTFYNYFENTQKWYFLLMNVENKLASMRKLEAYSYDKLQERYFQAYSIPVHIEDDHTPFLKKDVPIVHIIPYPFPSFWHEPGDNRSNVDLKTTENINKILRIFVALYLHIEV